jgi:catechol 2,3-dioxygenase-like lactoylglutathione lyase family enzyme
MVKQMRRAPFVAASIAVLAGLSVVQPSAQEASAAAADAMRNIVRVSKYIISVADAERSHAFYRDVFGLTLANGAPRVPPAQPIPELVQRLTSVQPPAMFRAVLYAVPGAADGLIFEHTEFTGPVRPATRPRMQDPGASFIVFNVRNLDEAMAKLKRAGGTIVTTNEQPVENNGNRAVFATGPDGEFIEMIQPPQVPPGGGALVVGSPRIAFVVADAEKAGQFYRDHLGLSVRMPGAANDTPRFAGLPGLPGSSVRSATVTVPGTTLSWQFYQYGRVERTPHVRNIPDPGAAAAAIEVRDIAAALAAIKAGGGSVLSAGGRPVEGRNLAFARDPSGVLLEVIQVSRN